MENATRKNISGYLAALASGDRSAVNPAFQALWPVVRGFCRRYLNHRDDAEDVAQNAMIKIFARASGFDVTKDGLTWALTIAMWECRTEIRKAARRREAAERIDAQGEANDSLSPEEEAVLKEVLSELNEQILQLSSESKDSIFMSLRSGGVLDARTRKRKQRALAQLRRWWEMFNGRV